MLRWDLSPFLSFSLYVRVFLFITREEVKSMEKEAPEEREI